MLQAKYRIKKTWKFIVELLELQIPAYYIAVIDWEAVCIPQGSLST
jgi:hypothetical protein